MKKFLLFVSILAILSTFLALPAFADVWGEGDGGWRSFISWDAWWSFIVDGLGLPRSG